MTNLAAYAQIAAAIATALLALFTWRLARAAKTEGGEMRKQAEATERLAAAAMAEGDEVRRQAEATDRHVAVSDEARPWRHHALARHRQLKDRVRDPTHRRSSDGHV